MEHNEKHARMKKEKQEKERDGFFDLYGISEEEEKFFRVLYRRRLIYRIIIAVLVLALGASLLLR